ncbi:MAG: FAD:protein FMN transferase, partial [Planctomycetota bacterium]
GWPSDDPLQAALAASGFVHVEIPREHDWVRFAVPGMRLDFGGIGKGWAADEAGEVLRKRGVSSFLIDFGGDLLAGDAPPDQPEGWRVRYASVLTGADHGDLFSPAFAPEDTGQEIYGFPVPLRNGAVATSGSSEQYVSIDNVRYSHVLDPATGLGSTDTLAATVIAVEAWLADAVATAASAKSLDSEVRDKIETLGANVFAQTMLP